MTAKPLTPKQQRFVEEYLVDLNATRAAIRAGYSEKTANVEGPKHLVKPGIAAAIKEKQDKLSKRTELTQEWVLERLKAIAEVQVAQGVNEHVKASDAISALEKIGKHLGMFVTKVETRDMTMESILEDIRSRPAGLPGNTDKAG